MGGVVFWFWGVMFCVLCTVVMVCNRGLVGVSIACMVFGVGHVLVGIFDTTMEPKRLLVID